MPRSEPLISILMYIVAKMWKIMKISSKISLYLSCACVLSYVWLFVTPWTIACQASLSTEFSRQEHWSGLPFPTLGALPNPGIETTSLTSPALAGSFFTTVPPGKPHDLALVEQKQALINNPSLWPGNTHHFTCTAGCPAQWMVHRRIQSPGSGRGVTEGAQGNGFSRACWHCFFSHPRVFCP